MNTTSPASSCPQCGSVVTTSGLCPKCLLARAALPTEDGAGTSSGDDLPALEEVRAAFPELEVEELIGRGGMGVVYKAKQKSLNRAVALKVLAPERVQDPTFADRFAKEAQALAALSHPNIVTVHNFGHSGGFYFLLMEHVDGVNLRQAMTAGRFTPEQALAIVPPVCEALQYAHDHGIVHRDIKPENILLDRDGRVKIADFGIAKMIGSSAEPGLDSATQAVGTPRYAAPEQQTNPHVIDHRADIYSLGVVLYELLTGEAPGIKLTPPSQRVQIDVRLDEVVLRALNVKPELRWQTATDLKTKVQSLATGPDGSDDPQQRLYHAMGYHTLWGQRLLKLGFLGFIGFFGFFRGLEFMLPLTSLFVLMGIATIVEWGSGRGKDGAHRTVGHKAMVSAVLALLIGLPLGVWVYRSYVNQRWSAGQDAVTLRRFAISDPTISKDIKRDGGAWQVDATSARVVRLFEVPVSELDDCTILYRASVKTENIQGQAFLEMWCHMPGGGEYFSRGLDKTLAGTNEWASYEIPFFLKKGEKPDLLKLNVSIQGTGKIWIKDVELTARGPGAKPLPPALTATSAPSASAFSPTILRSAAVKPVPFVTYDSKFATGDSITIESIEATSPRIGKGDIVVVRGSYTLQSKERAALNLFVTGGSSRAFPEQLSQIGKGAGKFELRCGMDYDGAPHVTFYPVSGGSSFGGIYFASPEKKDKTSHRAQTTKEVLEQVIAQISSTLKPMNQGERYTLPGNGQPIDGFNDDFLRRRTGREIIDSGLTCGCGDYALACIEYLKRIKFEALMVDGPEISFRALETAFSGHVVVAARRSPAEKWFLVDPTNRKILEEDWSRDAKSFSNGRFWIGYVGSVEDYPAHTPEELRAFLRKTLSTVPKDVFNQQMAKLNFRLDPSLYGPDGKLLNPRVERMSALQDELLQKYDIHPLQQYDVLLVNGPNDSSGTLSHEDKRGWVCTVGQQSACSAGFIDYMTGRIMKLATPPAP